MDRRTFLQTVAVSSAGVGLPGCGALGAGPTRGHGQIVTVDGPIDASALGLTLTHEHLSADLRPHEEQLSAPLLLDVEEAVAVVLPHLSRIRDLGCRSLVDATATHLGRNPVLLKRLSDASGLHIVTVTGNYAAADGRFVPPYVRSDSADDLARRWIGECRDGIGDTGVRPGLIKIGVDGGPLTETERKLVDAAAATHRETGLAIGAHVGPWREAEPGANAASAFEQIARLDAAGVAPSAWIWIHAQNEGDATQPLRAARLGAWVSFDGFRPDLVDDYVGRVARLRDAGLLHRVLISQDAGWYTVGEPGGGEFAPFHPVLTSLVPALRANGFTEDEVAQIFVRNPAEALAVRVV